MIQRKYDISGNRECFEYCIHIHWPLEAASTRVPVLCALKATNRNQQTMRECQVTDSHKQSVTFQDGFEGGCGQRCFRFACVSVKSRCSHQGLVSRGDGDSPHSLVASTLDPSLSPPATTIPCADRCHHRRTPTTNNTTHHPRNDPRPASLSSTGLSCERHTLSACFPVLCRPPHAGPLR